MVLNDDLTVVAAFDDAYAARIHFKLLQISVLNGDISRRAVFKPYIQKRRGYILQVSRASLYSNSTAAFIYDNGTSKVVAIDI